MTLRMLVLGDSIMWGQGLLEADKISSLVKARLEDARGEGVDVVRYAHSGADVWDDDEPDTYLAVLAPDPPRFVTPMPDEHAVRSADDAPAPDAKDRDAVGEMPRDQPYTLQQLVAARDALGPGAVDIVLVDAGANDVDLYNLALPHKRTAAVLARTLSFAGRTAGLLERIHTSFPRARIVVTGYYPVIGPTTDLDKLMHLARSLLVAATEEIGDWWEGRREPDHAFLRPLAMARAERRSWLRPDIERYQAQVVAEAAAEMSCTTRPLRVVRDRLASLSAQWVETIHAVLRADIDAVNARRAVPVAALAIPKLPASAGLFTESSLLWGLDEDLEPLDPLAQQRRDRCVAEGLRGFRRFVAERASLAHPTPLGAAAYADAVTTTLREMRAI